MGGIVSTSISTGLNAVAFSGGNYLFNMLSDHGAAERKRHDLAVENLQRARDQFYIARQKRLDFINKRLKEQEHSEQVFNDLDRAASEYYRLTSQKLQPLEKEPELSDFYHPSKGQKDAEITFIILMIGGVSYLIYRYI